MPLLHCLTPSRVHPLIRLLRGVDVDSPDPGRSHSPSPVVERSTLEGDWRLKTASP